MNEHYADGSVFSPMAGQIPSAKDSDTDTLKTICQELYLGLSIAADELKLNGDISRLVDYLNSIAKHGSNFPYRGMSFEQIGTFARIARDLVIRPKKIFLMTKINGEKTIQHETFTDLVGPIVEPNLGADEVAQVLSECQDVREVAQ